MPVQIYCPHCTTPCLVADEHLGNPVRCYQCQRTFTPAPTALPRTEPAGQASNLSSHKGPPRLDIGCATSAGHVRKNNEDSLLILHQAWSNLGLRHELALLAVADGMGGAESGEEASGLTIRTLGSTLTPLLTGALNGQFKDPAAPILTETIAFAIQEANRTVFRKGQANPACKGMGATLALALVWNNQVLIGHVGDCRVYHLHADKLVQVTKDQTVVARMVELGKLTPEEAKTHSSRNEVLQALGPRWDVEPASHKLKLQWNDWLILACDGLHAHIDGDELLADIRQSPPSASHVAQRLVELADDRGGSDNCTVIALYCP